MDHFIYDLFKTMQVTFLVLELLGHFYFIFFWRVS